MPALHKNRNRMISFRVNDQEYDLLHDFCAHNGSSSISDVARDAMRNFLGTPPATPGPTLAEQIQNLDNKVNDLARIVDRIAATLGHSSNGQ